MRAYLVATPDGGPRRYAGNQSDASTAKKDYAESLGVKKSNITTTEVEIPTDKPSLIAFINKLVDNG